MKFLGGNKIWINVNRTLAEANDLIWQFQFSVFLVSSGDVESGKKLHTIPGGRKGTEDRHVGHTAHILCMAISSDGKYLVSSPLPPRPAHDCFPCFIIYSALQKCKMMS